MSFPQSTVHLNSGPAHEQLSERSDAGTSIVPEVFGFVKRNLSGTVRSAAEEGCR